MTELISIETAAERLRVRPDFVQRMIDKGRLAPDDGGQLDAADVEAFGALLERLRGGGVATVIGAIGDELE
ncbi:hypothetical protein [Marinimicrobium sp. C2-29]|uniref:hypothetical protein n=1 Tax=Marinimicrobium sp. C2-29 TaxID=3139825 RepID=UPI0031395308